MLTCRPSVAMQTDSFVSQNTALQLSAALLRAILVNHVSHSEVNKQPRSMELSMKERLDEMDSPRLAEPLKVNLKVPLRVARVFGFIGGFLLVYQ